MCNILHVLRVIIESILDASLRQYVGPSAGVTRGELTAQKTREHSTGAIFCSTGKMASETIQYK